MALYLHETVDVVGGKEQEYIDALEKNWLPVAKKRDLRLVGFWTTVGTTGRWPEAVALWEMDDWRHYARLRETQYAVNKPKDQNLAGWAEQYAWQFRTGGYDRLLIPGPKTPTLAELLKNKVKGQVFLHEILTCVPGRVDDYLKAIADEYLPVARSRGVELVGSYKRAMSNTEAINIWVFKEWAAFAEIREVQHKHKGLKAWMKRAMTLRTDWEDKLLNPVSWNPLRG
ncbi:MAG: hypothetical protein FJ039_07305 [Chloroflexi bacterium]|nr:hypothetical protein [Chloroflexota bacterium]